jgi:hypothetical protein
MEGMLKSAPISMWVHGGVVLVAAIVAIVSFAFLIPLDTVQAVTGVSIIMAISYGIAFLAWLIIIYKYANNESNLVWLNTHLIFLVILPATIAATAMNVTAVQNTRNLLAGQISA